MVAGVACSSNKAPSSSTQPIVSTAPAASNSIGAGSIPGQTSLDVPAFPTYYDAHKDVVIVTDAYPKAAATIYHANYAPSLSAVKPDTQPRWFIIKGNSAPGQIAVLGSEPGESDYSPLWQTIYVTWKPGVTPVLLTSDSMIDSLAGKGQLTETTTAQTLRVPYSTFGEFSE